MLSYSPNLVANIVKSSPAKNDVIGAKGPLFLMALIA